MHGARRSSGGDSPRVRDGPSVHRRGAHCGVRARRSPPRRWKLRTPDAHDTRDSHRLRGPDDARQKKRASSDSVYAELQKTTLMLGDEMSVRRGRVARAEGRGEARPGGTKKLGVNETFAVLISGTRDGRRPSAGFGCVSEMSLAPPQSRGKEDGGTWTRCLGAQPTGTRAWCSWLSGPASFRGLFERLKFLQGTQRVRTCS